MAGGIPTVMLVAEKPSLAQSIAAILSHNQAHYRKSYLDVHEWDGEFLGRAAHFKMTSVIGHVLSIDFPPKFQNWETTDPASLFDAPTIKTEATPKAHVCKHLQQEAKGCSYLVLWLDCDREGENICFEVMENTLKWMMRVPGQQVFRARFSAISALEITAAMEKLGVPNKPEAEAVDARQELDLKVGVAFTRFQTRYFQGKYGNLDASVISYGPCQTPTLFFCVQRHQLINAFQPEDYWTIRPQVAKAGQRVDVEWSRGRLFDRDIGLLFQRIVAEARALRCTEVSVKEERRHRPNGLNTVELLKIASSAMGMSPQQAMRCAEGLYTSGYISYPRTESTAYPPNFDFQEILTEMRRHPIWGDYAANLTGGAFSPPKGGHDAGDHPPITPIAAATEAELGGGDDWRLYDYIARHFLGSLSPDCAFRRTSVAFAAGGERFTATGVAPLRAGFTAVMPWKAVQGEQLPPLHEGESLPISGVELKQGKTSPPDYLTESELIGLMEKHGIGTDASISVHIAKVCERYVSVQTGRRLVPTELGVTLVRGYQLIDPDLCLPLVRSHVEKQMDLIAKGQAEREAVVAHTLDQFARKFRYFVAKIERMDALFEASFSPLASSGKPLSKCGKCSRYMKLISVRPSRMYCPTCEEVLALPQGGTVKLYKGLACPLDGYEIVLFSLTGPDAKTYPLCPFCYNNPPAGAQQVAGPGAGATKGMPCTLCPHVGCQHSTARKGVTPCPECDAGTVVLDPVSGPKWRLDCNLCSFMIYLPDNLHAVKLDKERCKDCESVLLRLDFKKGSSPLQGGQTEVTACVVCDEKVAALCTAKHGRSYARRRGGGRSRGRRRGRGRRAGDPLMSFRDF